MSPSSYVSVSPLNGKVGSCQGEEKSSQGIFCSAESWWGKKVGWMAAPQIHKPILTVAYVYTVILKA